MDRLRGKYAVITGAGRGIGRATAEKFISEGAIVAIADFDRENGQQTAEALSMPGLKTPFYHVDISREEQIIQLFDSVRKDWGQLDILVNNAGILQDQTLKKLDSATFDRVIDVNLKGTFLCTKYAAEIMREQGHGVILNASSVVADNGNYGQTNYVASKSGVVGMTKVWARELGRDGIRVNAVAPGFIKTEMTAGLPVKVIEMMSGKVPLQRWGEAADIANAYCFLASDEAAYITGTVLNVNGGVVV